MDKLREKILVIIAVIVVVGYLGYNYGYVVLNDKRIALEDELFMIGDYNDNIESLQDQETSELERLNLIEIDIEEVKEAAGKFTINTQDFLLFTSTKTKELGIDIIKFKEVGMTENAGVWKLGFDVELNGYLKDLTKFSESIDGLGVKYDVSSMSIRVEGEPDYLDREFKEDNQLEWFGDKFKEEEEEVEVVDENTVTVEIDNGKNETTPDKDSIPSEPAPQPEPQPEPQPKPEPELITPDNIQDQLEIMLGIREPEVKNGTKDETKVEAETEPKIKKIEAPKVSRQAMKVVKKDKTHEKTIETFSTSRINMDFTIVFTMYSNPKDNYMNKDLYIGSEESEKIFIVDIEGNTRTISEINKSITEEGFLNEEITKVMDIIKEEEQDKDVSGLKEYMNYLMSRR